MPCFFFFSKLNTNHKTVQLNFTMAAILEDIYDSDFSPCLKIIFTSDKKCLNNLQNQNDKPMLLLHCKL